MAPGSAPNKWAALVVVALGVFMATLDTSIVNISLPSIARWANVPLNGAIAWVVIAYLVAAAALLLTIGRLADLVGRKRVWAAGLAVFTGGSVLCGIAPSLPFLVGARGVQGIGGAMLMALGPAILTTAFPSNERGRALGLNAIVVALGVSTGPTLGGVLTERLSWRWIFFVNVPIGAIGLLVTSRLMPRDARRARRERFDVLGATLLGIGLAAATAVISFGSDLGWGSPFIATGAAVAVVAFAALVPVERRRGRRAVLDASFFRNRMFTASTVALALSFLGLFATSFLMPFYLEQLRGFATEKAGLVLTAIPLTIAVVSPISGRIADRIGSRVLSVVGMTVAAIGLVLIATLDAAASTFHVVAVLVVTGIGQATFQPANNSALMGAAPRDRQGAASGVLATARVIGQSMSVAIAGAIFGALGAAEAGRVLTNGDLDPARRAAEGSIFLHGFRVAVLTCAAITAMAAVASLLKGKEERETFDYQRSAPAT